MDPERPDIREIHYQDLEQEDAVDSPGPRPGRRLALAILLSAFVGTAGVGVCFLLIYRDLTARRQPQAGAVLPGATSPQKRLSREDFKQLVLGKGQYEVLRAVGKPARSQESPRDIIWIYEKVTFDPVTGKTDLQATVYFDHRFPWANTVTFD